MTQVMFHRGSMSGTRFLLSAALVLCACDSEEVPGVTRYGPFHVKEISNVQIAAVDCESGGETQADVSFDIVGGTVCTNEEHCGDEYLELDERMFEVPGDPELDAMTFRCGLDISGEVVGDGDEGTEITLGTLTTDPATDLGCVIIVDSFQLGFASNPRLVISHDNQGTLIDHEDYAPARVEVSTPLACL